MFSLTPVGFNDKRNGVRQANNRGDFLDNTKYDMTYFGSDSSARNVPSNERSREINRGEISRNNGKNVIHRNDYQSFVQDHGAKRNSDTRAAFSDDQNNLYESGKYDMTHFGENDDDTLSREEKPEKGIIHRGEVQMSSDTNLDWSYRSGEESDLVRKEILRNLEAKRSSKHGKGDEEGWPPIGIPLPIRHEDRPDLEHKQTRVLQPTDTRNSRYTNEHGDSKKDSKNVKKNELSKDDESLDLDIEIKPLTASDRKYFDEDKSKLSSIPKKPNMDSEVAQKIEHVQTNIVSKSASKKTKVGVLVGGKLDQTKTDIVQNNSPDPTYDKVKDFFKSQQVSSIIDAPQAEKKEPVKLYNIPHEENVKRSSIPKPVVHPDRIRLDLKER